MPAAKASRLFIAQSIGLLSVVYVIREKSEEDVRKVLEKKRRNCSWMIRPFVDPGRCGRAVKLGD